MVEPQGLGRRVAAGATWVVSQRMAVRLIGLASTIVLARLLAPADFGLIALATSLAAILDSLAELGFDLALIQKRTATRQDYDTAWTLGVIRGAVVAVLLLALSHPMAAIYGDQRLVPVLAWLALAAFLAGLQNIGIVEFRRDLRFEREFALLVAAKLAGFVVTLALAWWWRDHRALIAGILASRVATLALTYAMHPFRPRLGLAGGIGFLHFSQWIAANSLIGAVRTRLDSFVLGKAAGSEALGVYTVAHEISTLALTELIHPISRAVHPGFARMAGDRDRLARSYLDVFAVLALLAFPIAVGIALTAEHIVRIFLGAQWLAAVPLIQILSLYGLVHLPSSNTSALYLAIGRPDLIVRRNVPPLLVLVPALLYGAHHHGPAGAAWALVLSAGVGLAVNTILLHREIGVGAGALLRRTGRPIAATAVMAAVVAAISREWPIAASLPVVVAQFAGLAVAGALAYCGTALLVWRLAGRPAGAEQRLLALAASWRRGASPRAG